MALLLFRLHSNSFHLIIINESESLASNSNVVVKNRANYLIFFSVTLGWSLVD
jgi:hypothetical protein